MIFDLKIFERSKINFAMMIYSTLSRGDARSIVRKSKA